MLKSKIKERARTHFGDVSAAKRSILEEIHFIDRKEEVGPLDDSNFHRSLSLKEVFSRKVRAEEIKWKQRSRCNWLKEGETLILPWHGFRKVQGQQN